MVRDRTGSVLRVRRIAQQQALAELAGTQRDEATAEAAERAARELLAGYVGAATGVAALRMERASGVALRHGVETAEGRRRAAAADRERAAERWQQARAQERAVERLMERRRRAAVIAAQAAEQARLDELALLTRGGGRPC